MTPSPEERANDIAGLIMLAGACDWGDGGRDVAVDLIASAIRDAESAALERAAAVCRRHAEAAEREEEDKAVMAICLCETEIESLKSKEP